MLKSLLASYITGCAFLHVRELFRTGRRLFLTRERTTSTLCTVTPIVDSFERRFGIEFDEKSINLRPRENFVGRLEDLISMKFNYGVVSNAKDEAKFLPNVT